MADAELSPMTAAARLMVSSRLNNCTLTLRLHGHAAGGPLPQQVATVLIVNGIEVFSEGWLVRSMVLRMSRSLRVQRVALRGHFGAFNPNG